MWERSARSCRRSLVSCHLLIRVHGPAWRFRTPGFRDLPESGQRFGRIVQRALLQIGSVNMEREEIAAYAHVLGILEYYILILGFILAQYGERLLKDTLQLIGGLALLLSSYFVGHLCSCLSVCSCLSPLL